MRGSEWEKSTISDPVKESVNLLLGGKPEVLFVMSGGIYQKGKTFRPTTIADPDLIDGSKFGYLGGIYRLLAAEKLAEMFPEAPIVTNSVDNTTKISHAKVYSDALVRRGIDQERIILQEQSETTMAEFKEMIKLSIKNNWQGPIAMITNGYHLERSVLTFASLDSLFRDDPAFLIQLEEFRNRDIKVLFANSEKILDLVNPRYKTFFATLAKKEPFASAIELREIAEANGITALQSNSYQKRF